MYSTTSKFNLIRSNKEFRYLGKISFNPHIKKNYFFTDRHQTNIHNNIPKNKLNNSFINNKFLFLNKNFNRIIYEPKIRTLFSQNRFYCTLNKPKIDQNNYYSKENIMKTLNSLKDDIKNTSYISEMNDLVDHVFKEMENRKYNVMRIKIMIFILILIILLASYDLITNWSSKQVNIITTKSFEDPDFKKKLTELCESTIKQLTESEEIQKDLTNLLKIVVQNLADNPEVQEKLSKLLIEVLKFENIKNTGAETSSLIIDKLINSPEHEKIRKEIYDYITLEINKLSEDKKVQKNLGQLMLSSLSSIFTWKK